MSQPTPHQDEKHKRREFSLMRASQIEPSFRFLWVVVRTRLPTHRITSDDDSIYLLRVAYSFALACSERRDNSG
jgi:hypothetical protein